MAILRLKRKLALKSDKNLKRRTKYKEMTYKKSILNDVQLSEEKGHTVAYYKNRILELEETIAEVSEKGYTKELTQSVNSFYICESAMHETFSTYVS